MKSIVSSYDRYLRGRQDALYQQRSSDVKRESSINLGALHRLLLSLFAVCLLWSSPLPCRKAFIFLCPHLHSILACQQHLRRQMKITISSISSLRTVIPGHKQYLFPGLQGVSELAFITRTSFLANYAMMLGPLLYNVPIVLHSLNLAGCSYCLRGWSLTRCFFLILMLQTQWPKWTSERKRGGRDGRDYGYCSKHC